MIPPGRRTRSCGLAATLAAGFLLSCGRTPDQSTPADRPDAAALAARLHGEDPTDRLRAAETLARLGPEGRNAAPALARALRDDDDEMVRTVAATAIGSMRAAGVEPLTLALRSDESDRVRAAAAGALGLAGRADRTALEALTRAAQEDASDIVRARAVAALVVFGENGRPAIDRALRDRSALVRGVAQTATERLKQRAAVVTTDDADRRVDELARGLSQGNALQRAKAAQDLGRMGRQARAAIPALTDALAPRNDRMVRVAAAGALRSLGPDAAPALVAALRDRDSGVRATAADGLGRMHQAADVALPALLAATKDREFSVRLSAVASLERFGEAGMPGLTAALQDPEWHVRERARRAIQKIEAARAAR